MIAQDGINKRGKPFKKRVNYDSLEICLSILYEHMNRTDSSIHMPRIGTGLGGGKWSIIEQILNDNLHEISVFVYDLAK